MRSKDRPEEKLVAAMKPLLLQDSVCFFKGFFSSDLDLSGTGVGSDVFNNTG